MSASLFSSKTQKSSRNLRKLSISSPLHVTPPTESPSTFAPPRSPGWTVVLRAKYAFEASAGPELTLQRGDHVRLLERPGNGWLKVQRIHEIGEGLVPASYLEIAMNDPERPVSSEWLNDYQKQASMRNRVAQIKVKCAYLSHSNNFWYRMDAAFNSGRKTYCAMFYEDFVSLHSMLDSPDLAGMLKLELPRRQSAVAPGLQNTIRGEATARAQTPMVANLDRFAQSLLRFAQCHSSNILGEYIDNQCTRKVHVKSDETVPSDEAIADSLVEGSLCITQTGSPTRNNSFSPTAPLPPIEGAPFGCLDPLKYAPRAPYQASNMKYSSYLNQSQSSLSQKEPASQEKACARQISTKTIASLNSLIDSYAVCSSDESVYDDDSEDETGIDSGINSGMTPELDSESTRGMTSGLPSTMNSEMIRDSSMRIGSGISSRTGRETRTLSLNNGAAHGRYQDVFDVFEAEIGPLLAQNTSRKPAGPASEDGKKDLFGASLASLKNSLRAFSSDYSSECNTSSVTTCTDSYEPRTPTLGLSSVQASARVLGDLDLSPLEPRKHRMFASSEEIMSDPATKFSWESLSHT